VRILAFAMLAGCSFQPGELPLDGGSADARQADGAQDVTDAPVAPVDTTGSGAATEIVIEAEDFFFESTLDGTHDWVTETSVGGFSGTGYVVASPADAASCNANNGFCGAIASYGLNVPVTGTYLVTVRHASPSNCCDSVLWSIGLGSYANDDLSPDMATTWTDDASPLTANLNAGMTTFNLRMREAGARIDQIRFDLQ
jgi:hypothetical protein